MRPGFLSGSLHPGPALRSCEVLSRSDSGIVPSFIVTSSTWPAHFPFYSTPISHICPSSRCDLARHARGWWLFLLGVQSLRTGSASAHQGCSEGQHHRTAHIHVYLVLSCLSLSWAVRSLLQSIQVRCTCVSCDLSDKFNFLCALAITWKGRRWSEVAKKASATGVRASSNIPDKTATLSNRKQRRRK